MTAPRAPRDRTRARSRVLAAFTPRSSGPPWIVGWRGSPLEAPENTRASLERALELELDGIAYDVRASRGGELVLHADADLGRTNDGDGPIGARPWTEIAELDAGGWFGARFRGERLMLLEEALALAAPRHVVLLRARVDVARVASLAGELARHAHVLVASEERELCLEARDAGLATMFVSAALSASDREFVEHERLAAVGARAQAWRRAGNESAAWDVERWMLRADSPDDLLFACRARFDGVLTSEPLRAHAARALASLTPNASGAESLWPVHAPALSVEPHGDGARGSWWGSWRVPIRVRNPLPWRVRATLSVLPRRGAFELRGVPVHAELEPNAILETGVELTGGAWHPGGDPLVTGSLRWSASSGKSGKRAAGRIVLDAPLERRRRAVADALPVRLEMLREGPRDAQATMIVRRRGSELALSVESTGGLSDVRALALIEGRVFRGARGLRVRLPRDFDARREGIEFSCGFTGVAPGADGAPGERRVRRFAGGLPDEPGSGACGRLVPWSSA